MTKKWKFFFTGYIFHGALNSLYQDFLGKDKYLKMADAGWLDPWITVPLALIFLVIVVMIMASTKGEEL
jgi:hypothetical protein